MENNNQIQQNQIDQILAEAGLTWPIENSDSANNQKFSASNLNWNSNNDTPPTYNHSYISQDIMQQPTQPDHRSPMPISVIRSLSDITVHKDMSQYLIPPSPESSQGPSLQENLPHERVQEIVETELDDGEEIIQDEVTENIFQEIVEEVIIEDGHVIMTDEMTSEDFNSEEITTGEVTNEEVTSDEVTTEEVTTEEVTTEEVTTEEVTTEEVTTEAVTTEEMTTEELTTEELIEEYEENNKTDIVEVKSTEEIPGELDDAEGNFLEEANSSLDSSLPGEVQCEFCGNSFPSNDLPAHQESILTEDGSPAFKCEICSMAFDKKCVSELHQSSCLPRSSLEEIEDCISSSEDERIISDEHAEQPEEEDVVDIPISFATEAGLQQHRLNKDGSDWLLNGFLSFQCDLCGDRFKNEDDMEKHIERNHTTDDVPEPAVSPTTTDKNESENSTEKSVQCEFCLQWYVNRDQVTWHIDINESTGKAAVNVSPITHEVTPSETCPLKRYAIEMENGTRCTLCVGIFTNLKSFGSHIFKCFSKFSKDSNIQSQQPTSSRPPPLEGPFPRAQSPSRKLSSESTDSNGSEDFIQCDDCGVKYRSEQMYFKHFDHFKTCKIPKNLVERAKEVRTEYEKILTVDAKKTFTPESYKCKACEKTFKSRGGFTMHRRYHCTVDKDPEYGGKQIDGEPEFFQCRLCETYCSNQAALAVHIEKYCLLRSVEQESANHNPGIYKFKCDLCLQPFVNKPALTSHRRYRCRVELDPNYTFGQETKKKAQTFKCDKCDRVFGRQNAFTRHVRYHCATTEYSVSEHPISPKKKSVIEGQINENGSNNDGSDDGPDLISSSSQEDTSEEVEDEDVIDLNALEENSEENILPEEQIIFESAFHIETDSESEDEAEDDVDVSRPSSGYGTESSSHGKASPSKNSVSDDDMFHISNTDFSLPEDSSSPSSLKRPILDDILDEIADHYEAESDEKSAAKKPRLSFMVNSRSHIHSKNIVNHQPLSITKSSETSSSESSSSIASLDSICSISLLGEDDLNILEEVQKKVFEAKNLDPKDKEIKTKLVEQKRLRLAAALSIANRQSDRHEVENTDSEDSSILDSSLQCPDCLTFFPNFRDFFKHLRFEHADTSPTLQDENSLLEDRYSHYVINRNNNFLYEICSDEDEDDEALIDDGEIIEGEKADSLNVICPECSKCLSSVRTLVIHMKVHRPPQFNCPTCSKEYTWKSGLLYHWNHSKCDKPEGFQFVDNRCGPKSRGRRGGRGRGRGGRGRGSRGGYRGRSPRSIGHVHLTGPPVGLGGELMVEEESNSSGFPCPHCPKIFSKAVLLKQHSAVHEPPKHHCEKCDKWFRWKQALNTHPCKPVH